VRKGKFPYGNDLLGLMLLALDKNRQKDMDMSKHELSLQALVDECKTFFGWFGNNIFIVNMDLASIGRVPRVARMRSN
jgi:hypothetical protein